MNKKYDIVVDGQHVGELRESPEISPEGVALPALILLAGAAVLAVIAIPAGVLLWYGLVLYEMSKRGYASVIDQIGPGYTITFYAISFAIGLLVVAMILHRNDGNRTIKRIILIFMLPITIVIGGAGVYMHERDPSLDGIQARLRTDPKQSASEPISVPIETEPMVSKDAEPYITAELEAAPAVIGCTVGVKSLRLRSGPSIKHSVIGGLSKGQSLSARARTENGDWVQIQTVAQTDGWVASEFLTCHSPVNSLPVTPVTSLPATR